MASLGWWALLALSCSEAVRLQPPRPARALQAVFARKEKIIRGAPSGKRLISKFRQCNISLVQQGGPPRLWGPSHVPALYNDIKSKTRFMHVYKNAGTTIAHAVEDRGGTILEWTPAYNDSITNLTAEPLDSLLADPDWLRVAFTRPPLQRVLASFHEEMVRAQIVHGPSNTTMPYTRDNLVAMFAQLVDEMNFTFPTSPLNRKSGIIVDGIHFLTQTNFMIDKDGKKHPLDYIGDSTNLGPELRHIMQDPDLQVKNDSGPEDKHTYDDQSINATPKLWADGRGKDASIEQPPDVIRLKVEDIPEKTLKALCRVYKDDFCCFGYEIPGACDIAC